MVKARRSIGLFSARSENQDGCPPLAPVGLVEQRLYVMRSNGAFESMEEHENRRPTNAVCVVNVQEIAVDGIEPLEAGRPERLTPQEFAP